MPYDPDRQPSIRYTTFTPSATTPSRRPSRQRYRTASPTFRPHCHKHPDHASITDRSVPFSRRLQPPTH
eukprot:3843818-Rhodomonas_salina.2